MVTKEKKEEAIMSKTTLSTEFRKVRGRERRGREGEEREGGRERGRWRMTTLSRVRLMLMS